MFNKKLISAAIVTGMTFMGGASASVVLTAGDFKFNFDNYDAGTTGYGNGIPVCNSVATCDTNINTEPGAVKAPGAIGSEDTWGIFSIQSITRISDNVLLYSIGQDGKFLTGMFGGFTDELVYRLPVGFPTPTDTTIAYSNHGWLNLYENASNYTAAQGPGGRTGIYDYTGITGGTLLLSALFAGTADAAIPGYSYKTNYGSTSYSGDSQGFMDVTGGSWAAMLDTNSLTDLAGGTRDLYLTASYDDVNGAASKLGWTVTSTGQVKGSAIPEPATLALLGLGLVSMASMRRRA